MLVVVYLGAARLLLYLCYEDVDAASIRTSHEVILRLHCILNAILSQPVHHESVQEKFVCCVLLSPLLKDACEGMHPDGPPPASQVMTPDAEGDFHTVGMEAGRQDIADKPYIEVVSEVVFLKSDIIIYSPRSSGMCGYG